MSDGQSSNTDRQANLRITRVCLMIWALVSCGFGIILEPSLASIRIGGADLGFRFAQQGSILVFLLPIFRCAARLNRLDR